MSNLISYLKHIVKDPITTIAETEKRKKEILPLFYGSIGVLTLGVILQLAFELDFMAAFSFIGLAGAAFCAFLFSVIKRAKKQFEALTCDHCHTLAQISTPEDYFKYISYHVEKDEAMFSGYTGNQKPVDGIYSLVKFSGSSSAVLSVKLTCPTCGEVKYLKYAAVPFKCHAEATKVGALQFAAIRTSLETAVKAAISDYNTPDKKHKIPYSFHSSKNSNFENRFQLKGSNGVGAHPNYMGVRIDYHKDVEEMLEHYFLLNELNGSLVAEKMNGSTSNNGTLANSNQVQHTQNDPIIDTHQNLQDNVTPAEDNKDLISAPVIHTTTVSSEPPASINRINTESEPAAMCTEEDHSAIQKPAHKSVGKIALGVLTICASMVVGGVIYGLISSDHRELRDAGINWTTEPAFSYTESTVTTEPTPTVTTETTPTVTTEPTSAVTTDPVAKIDINDFIGYWSMAENQENELTIHKGNGNSVSFSLWYNRTMAIDNVTAQLQEDVANFSLANDGAVVKGTLTFGRDYIEVIITQSTQVNIPVAVMEFTEQYMTSMVSGTEPTEDSSNEDQHDEIEAPTIDSNTTENTTPTLSESLYLLTVEEDYHYIYAYPSYESRYVQRLPIGTYEIVAEQFDDYHMLWGKLQSDFGWICITDITGTIDEPEFIIPYSSDRLLNVEDLSSLSHEELAIARNEIYARHGRKFINQEVQAYFNTKSWYWGHIEPNDFSESLLSEIERANVDFIIAYEKQYEIKN